MTYKYLLDEMMLYDHWHFDPTKSSDNDFIQMPRLNISSVALAEMKSKVDNEELVSAVDFYPGEYDDYQSNILAWGKRDHVENGYTRNNTLYRQYKYSDAPDYLLDIYEKLQLKNAYANVNRIDPGNILPWHFDTYQRLSIDSSKRNIDLTSLSESTRNANIKRYLVFLDDWHWGHFFEIGNAVFTHWKSGDVITWEPMRYHLAANCGIKSRYTLSVTGTAI